MVNGTLDPFLQTGRIIMGFAQSRRFHVLPQITIRNCRPGGWTGQSTRPMSPALSIEDTFFVGRINLGDCARRFTAAVDLIYSDMFWRISRHFIATSAPGPGTFSTLKTQTG